MTKAETIYPTTLYKTAIGAGYVALLFVNVIKTKQEAVIRLLVFVPPKRLDMKDVWVFCHSNAQTNTLKEKTAF